MRKAFILSLAILQSFCKFSYAVDVCMTIDDAVAPRVINAFVGHFGYQDFIVNPVDPSGPAIPNPVSKQQFFKLQLRDYIKGIVVSDEARQSGQNASQQTFNQSNNEIIITPK